MRTLLEKIEAHAVERLTLPAGRLPSQELNRYKRFLQLEAHRLKMLHRSGAGGLEVCRARATMMDVLLRSILEPVKAHVPPPARGGTPAIALVAIGGYGRGELNPFSDIDFMLLHNAELDSRGKPPAYVEALNDGLLYTLWDLGLKVGHSLRRVEDCVKAADENMQSKTSLLEARLITGSEPLFTRMQAVVLAKCVRGFETAYLQARLEDQSSRRSKYGGSATMQEPNIKNGCGGLRDYQNLLWMAEFKYRARTLEELEKREQITKAEHKQLSTAYDYLLRVRNELHYQTNRAADILTKSVQPSVANALGHTDRSPSKRIESFMRELYGHMRNIYLLTRMVEQRLALQPPGERRLPSFRDLFRRGKQRVRQQVVDGFKFVDGEIHPLSNRVFKEQPHRLMRVFLYAQQHSLALHPETLQLIRRDLPLVDRQFLRDEHVRETFLEILNQRGNVAPILRAMHEVEFLGKYMPEFGKLTCLVQHEFYHQYTADEHTLVCLAKLDQVWNATEAPYRNYAGLFREVERPYLLYLALLLHDSGKAAHSGHHEEVSSTLAAAVAKRFGFDGAITHSLRLVIESHLAMTQVSQRRDLEDPAEIQAFAARIQSQENLLMLTLHTLADSLGTSDQLWNDFKDTLLRSLYSKTRELLAGGTDFIRAEEKQKELLKDEVRRNSPEKLVEEELEAHFRNLPLRYFQIHSAEQISQDLSRTHRFMALQIGEETEVLRPVVDWSDEADRGYTRVCVCTWDRSGLFSKIAGAFTAAGMNILSAQIFTRGDGIILDEFYVCDAQTGLLVNRDARTKFEKHLYESLCGELDLAAFLNKKRVARPAGAPAEVDRLPTRIRFDNSTSKTRTIIDLETEDRLGLLHAVTQVLSELSLDLSVAKIATEKGAAFDTFYVCELDGEQVSNKARQNLIEKRIRSAVEKLDSPAKA